MSHRSQSVGDLVREILVRLIREEMRDPRVGFVTVTAVRMSRDLRHARVFVSFLEEDPVIPLDALRHAAPLLRSWLAREAGLRHVPELKFEIDESMVEGFRVEQLLEEVGAADIPPDDPEPSAPEDD